ncbi:SRPBCC family protein [Nocardiopsis sp. MG754419]|uniref:SRPBCC family protein n=1 Tax=Nocardiopsis sp. MG754419 TaxID=2259865 RepID=UPI001BAA146B|nr:SRPBCC family protein [Nocardiopsis sp. MG754419]MBR8743534.1 SRPBCC family protein [Nocardiopsis sp. MG754419]
MTLIGPADRTVPVTVQTRTSLPPVAVCRIIVPIDLSLVFQGWGPFPGVRGARDQTGPWDAVGRSRKPDLTDGSTAVERLTEFTAPHSFAYEITGFTNALRHVVTGVRGEWTFTPDGAGTVVRWTYEFRPRPGRAFALRWIIGPLWRRYMLVGVVRAARAAERIAHEG